MTFVLVALGHSTLTPIGAPDICQLGAQRLRQRHHADLRHRVRREVRDAAHEAGDRRGVHDVARCSLLQHDRQERVHAVDHAPEVDAEHPLPVRHR